MDNEWLVEVEYRGYNPSMDRKLEKAAKRSVGAAGFGFGYRDMSWYFKTKIGAENCLKRIKASNIRGVKIKMYQEED